MTEAQRQSLHTRFDFRCGYCGVSETQSGASLTVDHFQPASRGGEDNAANWVYACFACNTFKGPYWSESENFALLHPERDIPSEHWSENSDGFLVAFTTRGQRHIEVLHLNRAELVARRLENRVQVQRDQHIETLARELAEIKREMDELRGQLRV